jgi:hypothetical protein
VGGWGGEVRPGARVRQRLSPALAALRSIARSAAAWRQPAPCCQTRCACPAARRQAQPRPQSAPQRPPPTPPPPTHTPTPALTHAHTHTPALRQAVLRARVQPRAARVAEGQQLGVGHLEHLVACKRAGGGSAQVRTGSAAAQGRCAGAAQPLDLLELCPDPGQRPPPCWPPLRWLARQRWPAARAANPAR